jgi:hypothetical protein
MTNGAPFSDKTAFEALVDTLLTTNSGGSFGKIHMVTIGHGDDESEWQRLLPKASTIAERILHDRLGPEDACLSIAPGQYMLLFPSLTEAEGAVRAMAIAQEMRARLFGQAQHHVEVSVQVLPLSRLRPRPAAQAVEAMDKVLVSHSRQTGIDLDVVFQPVWSARKEAIVGSRARIRRRFNGREIFGNAVLFGGNEDPLALDVNLRLRRAVMRLKTDGSLLILPQVVNAHVLEDMEDFALQVGQAIAGREKAVIVELTGAVGGLPHTKLRQVIGAISARKAIVAVQMIPEPESARFLRQCGVSHLCLNEAQAHQAGFTPSAVYALFTIVAHETTGLGFQMCVWNAALPGDVKRAAGLGYGLFTGDAIAPHALSPATPQPWPADKIYR